MRTPAPDAHVVHKSAGEDAKMEVGRRVGLGRGQYRLRPRLSPCREQEAHQEKLGASLAHYSNNLLALAARTDFDTLERVGYHNAL